MKRIARLSAMATLRDRLHDEISARSRLCGHRRFACGLPRLAGRTRCLQHVLDEPNAPYRRCRQSVGARRCSMAAPFGPARKDSGLCFEHARQQLVARAKAMARPPTDAPTRSHSLLLELGHHARGTRPRTDSCASQVSIVSDSDEDGRIGDGAPLDPFEHIDAAQVLRSRGPDALDCRSDEDDSDEADEPRRAGGVEEDSSGAEDTPYDADPLRFAGVYTAEEVVRETADSLKRLQALYLGQLRVLTRRLRESRRTYLYALKTEKESHCSIFAQGAGDEREKRQLAMLKATASYRKRHGKDAILQAKLHEKRAKISDGTAAPRHSNPRCRFTEGGVKCPKFSLPSARHCLKHILNDRYQVLFRACGANKAGIVCQEPIAALNPTVTCTFHADLAPYQVFSLKKNQSDTDESDG